MDGENDKQEHTIDELQTRRELLAQTIKRKMAFFGHACRNNKCKLVKKCILRMMPGERRRGRPRMQYIDNIKKWTKASLEENVRLTEDRTSLGGCPFNGPLGVLKYPTRESPRRDAASPIKYNGLRVPQPSSFSHCAQPAVPYRNIMD